MKPEGPDRRRDGLSIRPQALQLTPQYRRLRDSILRPQLRLTESRYFWERWKPLLGPDATVLIMEVRDRCNRALGTTAEARDLAAAPPPAEGCTVSAADLAAACGFSRVTLWRLLQRDDVRRFIRVEHNYVYDQRIGKKRRTVSTYHVQMEDPLVDADEPRLQQLLAAQGLAAEVDPAAGTAPTFQSVTQVGDNSPPRLQSEMSSSGSRRKSQNVEETSLNKRSGQNEAEHAPLRAKLEQWLTAHERQSHAREADPPSSTRPARSRRAIDIWERYPAFAHYIEEAEAQLGDEHSRGFYVKALKRLYPAHMGIWQRALGLAREQQRIRRSRGALFTRLLRGFASEAGIEL